MPPTQTAEDKDNLLLVLPSNRMTTSGEDNAVRISKRARTKFGLGNKIKLECATESVVSVSKDFEVKKVYSDDLAVLAKNSAYLDLTGNMGFVSRATFNILTEDETRIDVEPEDIDVQLGTDPEFGLKPADYPHCKTSSNVLSAESKMHRFGQDGPCAEVRPLPSNNVDVLVKNTEAAFKQGLTTQAKDMAWLGGVLQPGEPADRIFQIGGHVHVGNPLTCEGIDFISFTPLLVKVLDEKLAVPIALLEGEDGTKRRTLTYHGQVYGNWGDYRLKPNKSPNPTRFEWRTASGAWVLTPSFYRATLHIVKCLSDGFYKMLSEMSRNCDGDIDENGLFKFKEFINKRVCAIDLKSAEEYKEFLKKVGSDKASVEKLIDASFKSLLSSVDLFKMDKSTVELFIAYCKSNIKDINATCDLKKKWVEGENEHLVGKNILSKLNVKEEDASKKKRFKLIKVS